MDVPVFKMLCLDSAGVSGAVTEYSQAIKIPDGRNAVQLEAILIALTAGQVSFQLQVGNDGTNFKDEGSAKTADKIGRHLLQVDSAVSAAYIRYTATIVGTARAILNATANISEQ